MTHGLTLSIRQIKTLPLYASSKGISIFPMLRQDEDITRILSVTKLPNNPLN